VIRVRHGAPIETAGRDVAERKREVRAVIEMGLRGSA